MIRPPILRPRRSPSWVLGALGMVLTVAAMVVVAGPAAGVLGLIALGLWRFGPIGLPIAIVHLGLIIPAQPLPLERIALVEGPLLVMVLADLVDDGGWWIAPFTGALIALGGTVTIAALTTGTRGLWVAAIVVTTAVALVSYGLHRYELALVETGVIAQ